MGFLNPEDIRDEKECPICKGTLPCGCDPNNTGNRPKYSEASEKIMPTHTAILDLPLVELELLLERPLSLEAVKLVLDMEAKGKEPEPWKGMLGVIRDSLLSPIDYGIKDGPLSGLDNIGLIGRWDIVPFEHLNKKFMMLVAIEGSDREAFEKLAGVSLNSMVNDLAEYQRVDNGRFRNHRGVKVKEPFRNTLNDVLYSALEKAKAFEVD